MPTVIFPLVTDLSTGTGCASTSLARSNHSVLLVAPYWPGRLCFTVVCRLLNEVPWPLPTEAESSVQVGGAHLAPLAETSSTACLATEGPGSLLSSCEQLVVRTVLNSRAPSTRQLYSNKWKLFSSWCTDQHEDPVYCCSCAAQVHAIVIV